MSANLTNALRGRLGLLRKPAHALAVLATATAATVTLTATPAAAASWHPYQVYKLYETCTSVGLYAVSSGKAQKYKCEWDSPYYLLSLYY
ncbi:hypothetical protein FH608_021990 [Nonomuraea phyllanthi]|uniref:Uncharacterized protein n=1 Tax=Nonomuraea phyllanthi TaxID=2219224 RepID=A0A5C4WDT0_9ACTN|nr:hypothetical protein [Nonomuraea phyllanthi]KAB8193016.1 hypothetical protein FH608_021990 [Nonomuraea phyllanthi]QFY11123.1 hypothetical protein GBF35_35070 [Nonomuraea phyllanthi]